MWSIECTPTAVSAPPGASSGCARQLSGGDELPGRGGVLRHHRDDGAEPAVGSRLRDLDDRRVEAAVEADRQHARRPCAPRAAASPALGRSSVIGFCTWMCLPASAAAIICAACRLCGVASTTASMLGRRAARRSCRRARCPSRGRSPRRWRACGCRPATNRMSSLLPCTAVTSERPQRPSPTMAARMSCATLGKRPFPRCSGLPLPALRGEGPGEGQWHGARLPTVPLTRPR